MPKNPTTEREDAEISFEEPELEDDRLRASLFDEEGDEDEDDDLIEDIDLDDLAAMEGPDA